jgi:hypothetical protein
MDKAADRSEQPMVEREGRRTAWGSPYPPFALRSAAQSSANGPPFP